jgi:hypothetical protein
LVAVLVVQGLVMQLQREQQGWILQSWQQWQRKALIQPT